MRAALLADVIRARVIFILRATTPVDLDAWVGAAAQGGASCLEITWPTPGALAAIARARQQHPQLRVGGGTVRTLEEVNALAHAGAEFVVSPHFDPALIEVCRARGLAAIPGVATPTEMMGAWRAGATALKLFPAPSCETVRALRAPLPELPLVAVGGVSSANLGGYLEAGCVAVGVGGSVFGANLTPAEIARRVREVVRQARAAPR
jgi:2-dehydro-3-deoxyphosphogluconate aldolase/(4S)-4-hydroxy-2-oxoglutarate aldolase